MSEMSRARRAAGVLSVGAVAVVAAWAMPQHALAQEQGQGQQQNNQGGGRGEDRGEGRGGEGRRFDPEQFRQRIAERMKQVLGATDEEWQVLEPRLEKVMTLQRQAAGGGRGMGMLFRGGGRGPGGDGDRGRDRDRDRDRDRGGEGRRGGFFGGGQDTPISQRTRELEQAIQSGAGPDDLKAKLAALREARNNARQDLDAARKELSELLTVKQEAALVMMGLLE